MMEPRTAFLYVAPGFADWEPAHALAELRRRGNFTVETVSLTLAPVESMGGIRILPSRIMDSIRPSEVSIFILPGGDFWLDSPIDHQVETILSQLDATHVPLAAICAATTAIARLGLLHGRRHTSNGREFLKKHVPTYTEGDNYVDAPAVRDRGLITASGLGDIEFAEKIFEELFAG